MNANTLYTELMDLCKPDDSPFYYVDQLLDGVLYRVFTYRLGSYSDFCKPSGLESRGHMFRVDMNGNMEALVCLPPAKFFNYKENPFTMDLDLSQESDLIMNKEDGSLISSYMHKGTLRLKSKTSLTSEQAVAAEAYLASNPKLYAFVMLMTSNGITVNMEFLSPNYRIVIPHQQDNLIVHGARAIATGASFGYEVLKAIMLENDCAGHLVKNYAGGVGTLETFIDSVPNMTHGIEGFVVVLRDGTMFKLKTNAYIALHRMKDSIGSQKRLFEVVVNEAHDDAKAAFADDAFMIEQIEDMERKVSAIYTNLKINVIQFYNENKDLDRKSYAVKGQADLQKMYFGLAMTMYLGKEPNFKEWMIKHYKELGIKDEPVTPVDIEE